MTSCHAILGRKTANCQGLLECKILRQNANNQRQQIHNLTLCNTVISDCPICFIFDPKNKNFFLKNYNDKIKFFNDIKTESRAENYLPATRLKTFQSNIFMFGCAMAPNPGKGENVTFWNAIFGISICRSQNK